MIANHIHDALSQVRKLQEFILEKKNFRGYSGTARMTGGFAALMGTLILASGTVPKSPLAQLTGWGVVLLAALAINYGALVFWFFFDPEAKGELLKLMPALDAIPALAVGAVLSLAVSLQGQYQFLFGIWMCLYGLVHVVYRHSLPKANYAVGVFYMLCGTYCLFDPRISFVNPWPMGLVFFIGESAGGLILYRNRMKE
jgi:hypothetical protein